MTVMRPLSEPPPRHKSGNLWFALFLAGLCLLGVALWLVDPSHRTEGVSRVGWPAAHAAVTP